MKHLILNLSLFAFICRHGKKIKPTVFDLNAFSSGVNPIKKILSLKLSCDSRFQRAFTACVFVFEVITLVWANQGNFFENATACSKRMRKTLVATQLKRLNQFHDGGLLQFIMYCYYISWSNKPDKNLRPRYIFIGLTLTLLIFVLF